MTIRWKHRQTFIALMCVMLLIVTAACGNGDDDDGGEAATSPASTSTTASGASGGDSTPTAEEDPQSNTTSTATSATATSATETSATASATEEDEGSEPTAPTGAQSTATESSGDEPSATATTATGASTATESSGMTTPDTGTGGVEVPEFETLDPELLPNFSLTMNFEAINLSGTPQTTVVMQMQQSAVDNYHLFMETDGEALEFWTIGEQAWTSIGGEVVESPTGPLFTPADILTTGELIPAGLEAREEGSEEVNGRQTTKWIVDGADYVEYMNEDAQFEGVSPVEMSNGTGEVTIWIDDELKIMIRADGDVAWDNSDGTQGSLVYDYEIHDIGSTADIVAPQ
ncbi:MAG TPA: hypothetical protein VEX37_01320 [Thermomicrobiales bacterium]|nr:hypothetical protein [Thermomicrobiales bacterium]